MSECYFCTSSADIEEHHIVPQRFDGSEAKSNKVDLCHECHWKLERLYNVDFWNAIGIDDPRATHESHVLCEAYGCMNPATGKHTVSGDLSGSKTDKVYRCDEHPPRFLAESSHPKPGEQGLKSVPDDYERQRDSDERALERARELDRALERIERDRDSDGME